MTPALTAIALIALVAGAILLTLRARTRRGVPVAVAAGVSTYTFEELSRPAPSWTRLRFVLVVALLASYVVSAITFQRYATLTDLRADVAAHRVSDLTLSAGNGGTDGSTTGVRTATWRTGLTSWRVTFTELSPGFTVQDRAREDSGDLAAGLRTIDPRLAIDHVDAPTGTEMPAPLAGLHGSRWLAVPLFAFLVLVLVLLVQGPAPWRATRWAWFWLCAFPGGMLLFLLLSGPTPRIREPGPRSRRVTGGMGFVIGGLGGPFASVMLAGLLRLVLPGHP